MDEKIKELESCLQNFYEKYCYDNTHQKEVFTVSCKEKIGGNCISLWIMNYFRRKLMWLMIKIQK
jgi:hypothetical protein